MQQHLAVSEIGIADVNQHKPTQAGACTMCQVIDSWMTRSDIFDAPEATGKRIFHTHTTNSGG